MKKLLPLMACTMLATAAMAAQTEPQIWEGYCITGISPNGTWAVSCVESEGTCDIINLETGEVYNYSYLEDTNDPLYSGGIGRYVSDNGVVVVSGYEDDLPYVWYDGEWSLLPLQENDYGAYPNSVTADGSRIAGSVARTAMSLDAQEVMVVPVVWNRNAEGGFDPYVELPYPTVDMSGRLPQSIIIDDISADGTVCAGMLVDYSGMMIQPIVISENAEGEWAYTLLANDLLNPQGLEFPPYPGEEPVEPTVADFMTPENAALYTEVYEEWMYRPEPEYTDFMTEEEFEAYSAALDAYFEDWQNNPYPYYEDYMTKEEMAEFEAAKEAYESVLPPNPLDYMTEEEYAEYKAAMEAYDDVFMAWMKEYYAFSNVLYDIMSDPDYVSFSYNTMRVSANGQYVLATADAEIEDEDSWWGYAWVGLPYVFNLADGSAVRYDTGVSDVIATMVTDEAKVLGATPSQAYARNVVVAENAKDGFVLLTDVAQTEAPKLYTWIEENLKHDIIEYVEGEDGWEEVEVEAVYTGSPVASADLDLIASWVPNMWDFDGPQFFSYTMPLDGAFTGIQAIESKSSSLKVKLDRNGILNVEGAAKDVTIYDVNGRLVFRTDGAAQGVNTGLQRGAYVVKATAADGKVVVAKANI